MALVMTCEQTKYTKIDHSPVFQLKNELSYDNEQKLFIGRSLSVHNIGYRHQGYSSSVFTYIQVDVMFDSAGVMVNRKKWIPISDYYPIHVVSSSVTVNTDLIFLTFTDKLFPVFLCRRQRI
jgi:hypothetical protein